MLFRSERPEISEEPSDFPHQVMGKHVFHTSFDATMQFGPRPCQRDDPTWLRTDFLVELRLQVADRLPDPAGDFESPYDTTLVVRVQFGGCQGIDKLQSSVEGG